MPLIKLLIENYNSNDIIQFLSKFKSNKPFINKSFDFEKQYLNNYNFIKHYLPHSDWQYKIDQTKHDEYEDYDNEYEIIKDIIIEPVWETIHEFIDWKNINNHKGISVERSINLEDLKHDNNFGIYWAYENAQVYHSTVKTPYTFYGIVDPSYIDWEVQLTDLAVDTIGKGFENEIRLLSQSPIIIYGYAKGEGIDIDEKDIIQIKPIKIST